MRFFACLLSFFLLFNSVCFYLPKDAVAASVDIRLAEQAEELMQLRKDKAQIEKKYFEATLEKTKLENELLDYKDKYFEIESSFPVRIAQEKSILNDKISILKKDLSENKEKVMSLIGESSRLRREVETKEQRLSELQDDHISVRTELEEIKRAKSSLEKKFSIKQRELTSAEKRETKLSSRLSELEQELDGLKNNVPQKIAEVRDPLKKKINLLMEELRAKNSDINILTSQLDEAKSQLDKKTKELSGLAGDAESFESRISRLIKDIERKDKEYDRLSSEKISLEKEYYEAQRDKTEIEKMLAQLKIKYQVLEDSFEKNIARESIPLKQRVAVLDAKRDDYEKTIDELKIEIGRFKEEIAEKDLAITGLQNEIRSNKNKQFSQDKIHDNVIKENQDLVAKIDSLTEVLNKAVSDVSSKDIVIEDYKKQVSELKLEHESIKDKFSSLKQEKEELESKLSESNKKLLKEQEEYQRLVEKITELREDELSTRKKLRGKQQEVREPLQKKIVMLQLKLDESEATIKSLTERLDDTTQELGSKMDRVSRLTVDAQEAEDKMLKAKDDLSKVTIELEAIRSEKALLAKSLYSLEAEKEELKREKAAIEKKYKEFKNTADADRAKQVDVLQEKINSLLEQKEANEDKIAKLQKELGIKIENVNVREGLLDESDKTIKQNQETIDVLSESIKSKEVENKNLMAKVISLNEELNSVQKDLSLKKTDLARYKERVYFLEQDQQRLRSELEKESAERGSLNVVLGDKEKALIQAQENEESLAAELQGLEQKLLTMKTSLARKVAMAKEPLQAKIVEIAALVQEEDLEISNMEKRLSALKQRIDEKTRSILRLKRKVTPYGEALGQTKNEKDQRKLELEQIGSEKADLEKQLAGVRADYKRLQIELDEAKKEQIKRGLRFSRRKDPLFETVESPVEDITGRIIEPLTEKIKGLSLKVQNRADDLKEINDKFKIVSDRYAEKEATLSRLADENVLYSDALEQTQKEIVKLNTEIKSLTTERLELKEKLAELKEKAVSKKTELDTLKVKHVEVESSLLDQVVQTRNLLQKKVETLSKQKTEAQKAIVSCGSETEILKQQLQQKDIQIASLNNRINLNEDTIQQTEQQLKQKEVFGKAAEEEFKELKRQHDAAVEQVESRDKQIVELEKRIASLQSDHDKFGQIIKRSSGEKEYLTRELIGKSELLSQLQDEQLKYVAEIDELGKKLNDVRSSVDEEVDRVVKQYKKKIQVLEEELNERREAGTESAMRLDDMERVVNEKNKELSRLSIDLNECTMRQQKVRESLGVRADELEVLRLQKNALEKELFKARLDSDEMLKEVVGLREENERLKTELSTKVLAVKESMQEKIDTLKLKKNEMDSLLVESRKEKEALQEVLQDTELNLSKVKDKLELSAYKVEQVEQTVAEIAGENKELQQATDRLNKELAGEQEVNAKLREEIRSVQGKNAELMNEKTKLNTVLKAGVGDKEVLAQDLLQKTSLLAEVEEKYKQSSIELARIREKLAKARIRTEDKVASARDQLKKKIEKLSMQLDTREKSVLSLTKKLSDTMSSMQSKTAEVTVLKAKLAKLSVELEDCKKMIQSRNDELMRSAKLINEKEEELRELKTLNNKQEGELEKLRADYAALQESIKERLLNARKPIQQELNKVKAQLVELQAVHKQLRDETPKLSQMIEAKNREISECDRVLNTNVDNRKKLEFKIKELEGKLLAEKASYVAKLADNVAPLKLKIKELEQSLKDKSAKLSALHKEREYLESELATKNELIVKAEQNNATNNEQYASLKVRLDESTKLNNSIKSKCDSRIADAKELLENEIVSFKAKLIEKDATIKLLADHIEENKKLVDSLKKELGLYSHQSSKQADVFDKTQKDLSSAKKEINVLQTEREQLKQRNKELLEMVKTLTDKATAADSKLHEKTLIVEARDKEIIDLQQDQKELTSFLKKEIEARKANIKELVVKTKALNETKLQYKKLIEKLRVMQEGMLSNN